MHSRKRRPTFDVVVQNIPKHVTQKDVEKKFVAYGEVSSFYFKPQADDTREAVIGYLCEPDANKAVDEHNGFLWGKNIIVAKRRVHKTSGNQRNHPIPRPPFYKPEGMSSIRSLASLNMNLYPCFPGPYPEPPFRFPTSMNAPYRKPDMKGMAGNHDWKKGNANMKQKQDTQNRGTFHDVEHHSDPNSFCSIPDVREINVTFVEDCVTFYGQCTLNFHRYEDISSRMQRLCPSLPVVKCIPAIGELYGAVYSNDHLWYRCKILFNNRSPGKSYVQYVDYGNCEDVDFSSIVELPKSIIAVPYFAPKCTLVTVEASSDRKVAYEGFMYLEKYILGKVVDVHTYSSVENPVYEVIECKINGADIIRDMAKSRYVTYKKVPQVSSAALGEQSTKAKANSSPTSIPSAKNSESGDNKLKFNFPNPNKNSSVPQHHNKAATLSKMKANKKSNSPNDSECAEKERLTKEVQALKSKVTSWQQKCKQLEKRLKEKETDVAKYNVIKQLETVASHVQLVNSIRCTPPTNDIDICSALAMLIRVNDPSTQEKHLLQKTIEDMLISYNKLLSDIKQCSEKIAQDELIKKKNSFKEDLCDNLKKYEDLHESSKNDVVEIDNSAMQEMAKKLKSKEKSTSDMTLSNTPSTIDDILLEYKATMLSKSDRMEKVRKESDAVLEEFQSVLSDFLKSFTLYSEDTSPENEAAKQLPFMTEGILTSDRFKKSLDALWNALENEIKALYVECDFKDTAKCTLVQCLMKELQNVEKRESKEELLVRKYHAMVNDLSDDALFPPKLSDLLNVRQGIKAIKSRLRHALVDKKDLEEGDHSDRSEIEKINSNIQEFRKALHIIYNEEDDLLKQLSKLCTTNYPEFELQHPELNLETYRKYDGLYKQNWELEEFNCEKSNERGSMCYEAMFGKHPVIIKEFLLDCEDKSTILLEKIMQWHALPSEYLVPIWAVFKKGDRQMFVMMPRRPTLLDQIQSLSKTESCDVLAAVLKSIHTLHKNGIVHGSINLVTIFFDDKEVSLDFCFKNKYVTNISSGKEVNFQSPEVCRGADPCKASDMFSFGCLVLSLLLQDIPVFSNSAHTTRDLSLHQKEIKEVLSPTGYSTVSALIQQQLLKRPTADSLLQNRFLHILMLSEKPDEVNKTVDNKVKEPASVVNETMDKISDVAADGVSAVVTADVSDATAEDVGASNVVTIDVVSDATPDDVGVSDLASAGGISDLAAAGVVSDATPDDVGVSDVATADVSDATPDDVGVSDVATADVVSDATPDDVGVSDVAANDADISDDVGVSDVAANIVSDVSLSPTENVDVSNVVAVDVSNVTPVGVSNVTIDRVNNMACGVSDADDEGSDTDDGVNDVDDVVINKEANKATNIVNDTTDVCVAGPSKINTEIKPPKPHDPETTSTKGKIGHAGSANNKNTLAKMFALREPLVRSTNSKDVSPERDNCGGN